MTPKELFNKYLSLFIIPLLITLYGIAFASMFTVSGWEDLIGALYIIIGIGLFIGCGIYLLLDKFLLKFKLDKWWKNILMSIAILIIEVGLINLLSRFI